jgi:hypothetical protein
MPTLQLPPLHRKQMAELKAKAKTLGLTPERYAKKLVEDGLALEREAETKTFAEIMAPVRTAAGPIDEAELLRLVDKARTEHHRRVSSAAKAKR